jgi:hypothetical protein
LPPALFEETLGRARPTDEKIKRLVEPLLEKGCYYLIAAEQIRKAIQDEAGYLGGLAFRSIAIRS